MRAIALALWALCPAFAAPHKAVLWTIGTPDQSSREFSAAREPVAYQIGKSSPGTHWRRTHPPGEAFLVRFSLPQPAGTYELNVGLLFRDPYVPRYSVTVNGKQGSFWLRPEPRASVSEADLNVLPSAASQRLSIRLPARLMRKGENEIQLRTEGGSLDYDALSLEQDAAASGADPQARLEPTVLWQRRDGVLYEQANVVVSPGALGPGVRAALRIGGQTFTEDLPAGADFGEAMFTVAVRDLEGRTLPATLTLTAPAGRRTFALQFKPQRKWKLFVAPSTHLDIGYTAIQPKAVEVHLRNLEEAAVLAERYPSFRWNVEGSWAVQQFLDRGGAAAGKALEALAGGGKLGVNAFEFNLQAYLCSLEELNAATDRSYALHQRAGTPFQVATVTDVPSLPWSLPSILHAAGIRYLASGANQVRGPLLTYSGLDRRSPFFWEGPDGARVLVWYTKSYAQVRRLFGIPGSPERTRNTLQSFLSAFPEQYAYDAALVYGFDGDNAPVGSGNAEFFDRWNVEVAYPQLIPARYEDFFSYLEQKGVGNLPVFRGDGGAYWEDGAGECPIATAVNRGNQANAVDLEKLAALASLSNPRLAAAAPAAAIWQKILLFDEHTFGARAAPLRPDAPDARLQWPMKSRFATEAAAELSWKRLEWLDRLNHTLRHARDAVVVWNLDNWRRSGPVEVQLPPGRAVFDAGTRQLLPCEIVSRADNTATVRFLARDVPPLSYKLFVVERGEVPEAAGEPGGSPILENEFYRIALDPRRAGIASIRDKQLRRELVSPSRFALGEYFEVRETSSTRRLAPGAGNNWYTGVRTRIDMNDPDLPAPVLSIERPSGGRVVGAQKTGVGQQATVEGMLAGDRPVRLTVRLYSSMRRIDLEVKTRVDFARDGHAEAAYVAFPFALADPEFAYDLPLGWVNPAKDMLPGAATEWFAIHSAAAVSGKGTSLTVAMPDTPLITFGDINRGEWPKAFAAPRDATVFSYVKNNYWLTNFPAGQETGEAVFRYFVTSAPESDRAAQRRFGEEQRHALLADFRAERSEPASAVSNVPGLRVDAAAVNLVTMKPARSGNGYVLRLAECGGNSSTAAIQWNGPVPLRKAFLCSLKEQKGRELEIRNGRIEVSFSPHSVQSVLLEFQPE